MGQEELASMLPDPEPHQRFLATYIEDARRAGVFTNAKLFERFPHQRLFGAYADEPASRAKLLCANSKMPLEYAKELDVPGCVQVFDIALNRLHEATPDKVFEVVTADELVRVVANTELYAFLDETKWYERDTPENRELARVLLQEIKAQELGGGMTRTLLAIEEAIGIDLYVEHLPKSVLAAIIRKARELADKLPGNIAFTVDAMAEAVTTDVLAKHLPLPVLVRPLHEAARQYGWVKPPPALPKKPDADIPAEVRDRIDPPTVPPPAATASGDGDPEVVMSGDTGDEALDLDAEADAILGIGEDASDKSAAAPAPVDSPAVPKPTGKVPPPLRKRSS